MSNSQGNTQAEIRVNEDDDDEAQQQFNANNIAGILQHVVNGQEGGLQHYRQDEIMYIVCYATSVAQGGGTGNLGCIVCDEGNLWITFIALFMVVLLGWLFVMVYIGT